MTPLRQRLSILFRLPAGKAVLARGSAQVGLIRSAGVGSAFLGTVVIARALGAEESGIYFLAITVVTIVASLVRLGLEHALTRHVAVGVATERWRQVNGAYLATFVPCTILAGAAAIGLFVFADSIAVQWLRKPQLGHALRLASLSVLPTTWSTLQAHAWQGRKNLVAFVVLQISGLQFLMLAACAVLLPLGALTVSSLLLAYGVSSAILAMGGMRSWWSSTHVSLKQVELPVRSLFSAAPSLFTVVALNLVLAWAGHLTLGIWGTTADVAIFSGAYRMSALLMLVSTAITNAAAPEYAAAHATGNRHSFSQVIGWATRSMALASAPFLIPLVLFPSAAMSLLGGDFTGGAAALQVMALGQLVNVLAGYPSFILIMTGHERDLAFNVALSAVAALVLMLLLTPRYGVTGAAIAQSLAIGLQALLNASSIHRKLGVASWRWQWSAAA